MTDEASSYNFVPSCLSAIALNVALVTLIHIGGCMGQNKAYSQITENISAHRVYTNQAEYLLVKTRINTLASFKDQNKELKLFEYEGAYLPLEKIKQLESQKAQRQTESNLIIRLQKLGLEEGK
jgi:hypothetical protein